MNPFELQSSPRPAPRSSGHSLRGGLATLALCFAAGLMGCHKGGSGVATTPEGTILDQPGSSTLKVIADPNSGGQAGTLRVRSIQWGRLADVFDETIEIGGATVSRKRHEDFLVSEGITTTSDYVVTTNSVTERTTIRIRHPFDPSPTSEYMRAIESITLGLITLTDKSLDASELPPYPLLPRNAALMITFDDLLDPATVSEQTVKVFQGYPPNTPFDARVFLDPNHGDLIGSVGNQQFRGTRVIVDTTVSVLEAQGTNPPLPVNSLGLPPSVTEGQPNIAIRIPTRVTLSQTSILQNLSGHPLSTSQNGSMDSTSASRDIVRAIRSGGSTALVGDPNNGFLVDTVRPYLIGTQPVTLRIEPGVDAPGTCSLEFNVGACGLRLLERDVIKVGTTTLEVICPTGTCPDGVPVTGPLVGSIVSGVPYTILDGPAIQPDPNVAVALLGQVSMRYYPGVPLAKVPCFVRFPSIGQAPNTRVQPDSSVIARFSKPMDPATMTPFDSMVIVRRDPDANTLTAYDYVVGQVTASPDLREYTFSGVLPLRHDPLAANPAETYFLQISGGAGGPTDLAGNTPLDTLPRVNFSLDPQAAKQDTDGFALRFSSNDEIAGIGNTGTLGVGKRELRGQFLFDFQNQKIKPRPVTHYSAAADRTQAVPSIMAAFAPGVQTPLSKLGSKLQTIWRYCDVGFTLLDESNFNVDVEGLNWSPIGGSVIADNFTRFEISLSHSLRLPDETVDANLLPLFPNSGLVQTYAQNVLDAVNDPLRKVYPIAGGPTGYTVIPSDAFQGPTGTIFMPWPLNRGIPTANFAYYTYRDTALQAKGGPPDCPGAELPIVSQVTGVPNTVTFTANNVPTIGLPLLMEFRCYPDDGALGLNPFDISIATASSARPNFRAFSTGGVNTANVTIRKNPDTELVASGGFNPTSTPTPGVTTLPIDNSFYIGQLELVVRISRVHSIWFDTGSGTVVHSAPVVEPRPNDQPTGTQVRVEFRAATTVTNNALLTDALMVDMYGERPTTVAGADPSFVNNDKTWKANLVNGARFFQTRLSFISNAETNLSPDLSALGFSWRR